jgi:hypothetical protein
MMSPGEAFRTRADLIVVELRPTHKHEEALEIALVYHAVICCTMWGLGLTAPERGS